jgi:hypothetical protein
MQENTPILPKLGRLKIQGVWSWKEFKGLHAGIGVPATRWGRGHSFCISVLPHVRSNFCGLGVVFCLKKRVLAGTNRPLETSTLPQYLLF